MEKLLTDEPEPGAPEPVPPMRLSASLVPVLNAPRSGVAPVPDVLLVSCAREENVPLEPASDGLRPELVKVCVAVGNPVPVPRDPEESVLEKEVEPPREGLVPDPVPEARVLLENPEPVLGDLNEPVLE